MQAQSCNTTGQCSSSSCGPCQTQGDCKGGSCSSSQCCSSGGGMMGDLMSAAHCAKKELMKEKLKVRLESKIGKKMDQIADHVTDMFVDKLEKMIECSEKKDDADQKLHEILKG